MSKSRRAGEERCYHSLRYNCCEVFGLRPLLEAFSLAIRLFDLSTFRLFPALVVVGVHQGAVAADAPLVLPVDSQVDTCIADTSLPGQFVQVTYQDPTPLPAVSTEQQQRGYLVFQRHWMDLVFPNSVPKQGELRTSLEFSASPGEYEPLTFCVRALRSLGDLSVTATELLTDDGFRLRAPEVRIVRTAPKLLEWNNPLYKNGPVGLIEVPTYLERNRSIKVLAETTVQFWLTVKVRDDAFAGAYKGKIKIHIEGGGVLELPLALNVWPVTLIEPERPVGMWDVVIFSEDKIYRDEYGPLDAIYADMREHGMTAVSFGRGFTGKELSVDQKGNVHIAIEGSEFERSMEAANRAGFREVLWDVPGEIVGWLYESVRARADAQMVAEQHERGIAQMVQRFSSSSYLDNIKKEIRYTANYYYPLFSEEYGRGYIQIIRSILEEVDKRGWPRIIITPGDESPSRHLKSAYQVYMPLALRHLELLKQAGATTFLNDVSIYMDKGVGDYVRACLPYVDIAMPNHFFSDAWYGASWNKLIAGLRQDDPSQRVYVYNMALSLGNRTDPTTSRFAAGYFFHTTGKDAEGLYDFIYMYPQGNVYDPLDTHVVGDDWIWVYPPQQRDNRLGGPYINWEARREGRDDDRYLYTLTQLIEQAEGRGPSFQLAKAATEARASLKNLLDSFDFTEVRKKMIHTGRWDALQAGRNEAPVIWGHLRLRNGWSFDRYDQARQQLAEQIITLQQLIAAQATEGE